MTKGGKKREGMPKARNIYIRDITPMIMPIYYTNADPSSRYYERDHFDVAAVCVGRFTGDWSQFRYVLVRELPSHRSHPNKLQVMHLIPDGEDTQPRWFSRFQDLIDAFTA
jgi:hypothetical protein